MPQRLPTTLLALLPTVTGIVSNAQPDADAVTETVEELGTPT